MKKIISFVLILIGSVSLVSISQSANRYITVASTTSTQNSGLYEFLLPVFEKESGIAVRVVAVGTGKAIKMAERGDADLLLVHHKPSEVKFTNQGYGVERLDLMYNDFVLVGPKNDPANVLNTKDISQALKAIYQQKKPFVSRADDSGTHKKELSLWSLVGLGKDTLSGAGIERPALEWGRRSILRMR